MDADLGDTQVATDCRVRYSPKTMICALPACRA